MSAKTVHIVGFDIPYPPDYGGVIDIYYKLEALKNMGLEVKFHTFTYRRNPAPELQDVCSEVFYYERKTGLQYNISRLPYIVLSRKVSALLENLLADPHPVLLEGLHTTGYMENLLEAGKKVFVRTHNIEHEYYRGLAQAEGRNYRKLFFRTESIKLESYEPVLKTCTGIAAISPADIMHFSPINPNTICIPPFHPEKHANPPLGLGEYALYHGNLEIPDNVQAAIWLAEEVFPVEGLCLVIAGKNPPLELREKMKKLSHVRMISSPNQSLLEKLLKEAQVNVLPTFIKAGVKLKLIKALFNSRWCLVNPAMAIGSGLESCCIHAEGKEAFRQVLQELKERPFTEADRAARIEALKNFDVDASARKLATWMLGDL